MRVKLTPSAERDLDDIEAYIATDNPVAAIDTVLRVIDSLAHLGEHTEMGLRQAPSKGVAGGRSYDAVRLCVAGARCHALDLAWAAL